ncbi:MAG: methyltransferase domain-containing protein [Candidatus Omnitrophota bacterium]|nr:methyltransferase domain-containing protein [Candidatus Omnitrophota bacterium]MDZ4241554.1 methyltransferase domain-containing protein [Candidatus Omnitrophota bacterium]
MTNIFQCVSCRSPINVSLDRPSEISCNNCQFKYIVDRNYLQYGYDQLLLEEFKEKYLLNKALNNNGYLSYIFLKEGSLSLPGRDDVALFRDYILSKIKGGRVLDAGCGVLELPGYLQFPPESQFELFGIDPIENRSFRGTRITGCTEFLPFTDESLDAVVFATSLDHVCSLQKTILETKRILVRNGKILIWMGDRSKSFLRNLKTSILQFLCPPSFKKTNVPYRVNKFYVYPNYTVFYIPDGAIDPFHAFNENPKEIIKLFKKEGFVCDDYSYHNQDLVFLTFAKGGR